MRNSKLLRRHAVSRLPLVSFLPICLFLLTATATAADKRPGTACTTAEQCLSLGMFYYNNDDITDKASQQFKQVITRFPKSTAQVESAQYFLGSYYQRKYYIQSQRLGKGDRSLLDWATKEYRKYTDQFYKNGSSQWLADAFFNMGLAYLQLGDSGNAYNELSKMRDSASRDKSVYIYEVVWSPLSGDIIDGFFPTVALADVALGRTYYQTGQQQANAGGDPFAQRVATIKRWCQSQKSRSSAK